MNCYQLFKATALSLLLLCMSGCDRASEVSSADNAPAAEAQSPGKVSDSTVEEGSYSPPVRNPTPQLYWGDTHLHTQLSADAYLTGTRLTSEIAFQFARGKIVTADNGMRVKLRRPLDFLAIADHGTSLGIFPRLMDNDPALADWEVGKRWSAYLQAGNIEDLINEWAPSMNSVDPKFQNTPKVRASIWEHSVATADAHNEPGLFTAFAAYEWTSAPDGNNLHRVVLYKDGAEKVTQTLPFTAQDSPDPEQLWSFFEDYERLTGGEVLAIPHNSNVSNGRMFSPQRENGSPLDKQYVAHRARWEPVLEVTQVKGDSETHPYLSPDDPFADFETWDEGNIAMSALKEPWMLQYDYARSALKDGLAYEAALGVNPFKFGMIGSTDSHTGLSTSAENNFFGKFLESEPKPDRITEKMAGVLQESWQLGAAGLAAVWAEENTREALFAAIKRREVYATTGPRIEVRFFAGWAFNPQDLQSPDLSVVGYHKGVPMGADLASAPVGQSPSFLLAASKDPGGANLDRIQVIKGWLDSAGKTQEKVYDVALSGGRKADQSVGTSVRLEDATYTNSIGVSEFAEVWVDPDFDPELRAFYYVRVLEIPTPRWTTYDAHRFKVALEENVRTVVQDRAYTSAIWYTP